LTIINHHQPSSSVFSNGFWMFFSGQIRSQLTELELGISGALNVTERMEMLNLAIGLAIFLHIF